MRDLLLEVAILASFFSSSSAETRLDSRCVASCPCSCYCSAVTHTVTLRTVQFTLATDRQRNRRLDSRSSEPLDNFAHANRDDATDAPTTRSFRIHVYFCPMREAFRKSNRNDSAKRFSPRLVSLLRFKRKIARYNHDTDIFSFYLSY